MKDLHDKEPVYVFQAKDFQRQSGNHDSIRKKKNLIPDLFRALDISIFFF